MRKATNINYELDPELVTMMAALGMVLGTLDLYDEVISWYAGQTGVPFLSVGYRRAPDEGTGTTLSEDVFAGLAWLVANAGKLGVNPARVAVMGDSGGGAPAVGAAILARDRGIALARHYGEYLAWRTANHEARHFTFGRRQSDSQTAPARSWAAIMTSAQTRGSMSSPRVETTTAHGPVPGLSCGIIAAAQATPSRNSPCSTTGESGGIARSSCSSRLRSVRVLLV